MLTMRDHEVEDYAGLRHMDATDVGVLGEDDRDCLNELGQYLVSTEAWQRFAIWLLHKHFEPEAGEVFVERSIAWPPQTHTTPIPRAAFSQAGLKATATRFDTEVASRVGLIGMEFAGPADFGPVAPISDADQAVLAGLAARLQSHGKIDRFGVRLIRNQLGLSEHQVLSETCDARRRAMHCDVIERHNIPTHNTVETSWQWKPALVKNGHTAPCTALLPPPPRPSRAQDGLLPACLCCLPHFVCTQACSSVCSVGSDPDYHGLDHSSGEHQSSSA